LGVHPATKEHITAPVFVWHCPEVNNFFDDSGHAGPANSDGGVVDDGGHVRPSDLIAHLADILAADGNDYVTRGYDRADADAERYARAVCGDAPLSAGGSATSQVTAPVRDPYQVVGTGSMRRLRFSFTTNDTALPIDFALPAPHQDGETQDTDPPLPDPMKEGDGDDPLGLGFELGQ
jgi:hypothetical protein